ncbi:MAG: septum site-determining protein MinD, partial [Lachnospiraceae bacterium]
DMMSIDDVVDILSIDLIGVIPDDEHIVVSTNQGEPVVGNGTVAGQAFSNICGRILGQDIPFLDLVGKRSFFVRFTGLLKRS